MFTALVMIMAERRRMQDARSLRFRVPRKSTRLPESGTSSAVLGLKDHNSPAEVVTGKMVDVPGIVRTYTHFWA